VARLKGAQRQKNQLELAFGEWMKSEARSPSAEGTEAPVAKCSAERLAPDEQWMERVCQRENLWQALKRVKRNGGSPGIDGMTVDDLPGYLKQHWLEIREQLLSGTYQPQPVRRVEIPKPDGGVRKLGVPTVLDRMIQQAVMQVLQGSWDNTFSESSYGFRPGRSAHQAVARAQQHIAAGYRWVVDLDLEKFFDRVNHDRLMGQIARRVRDKRLLRLIRSWLKAGVMENGLVGPTDEGTPQGGPLTPLTQKVISNLRGHWLVGGVFLQYLTCALRGNMFMTDAPINQSGQGSAVERSLHHASEQCCDPRGHAAIIPGVRSVRTAGIPIPGGSDTTGATCRGHRGYGTDHPQGSRGNSAPSSGSFEKYRADHWSHRDTGIGHVSEHTEKTWLSRAQRPAPFKFTLNIFLTACTIRNSPKPTAFWYPFGSVPSAAV